MSYLNIKLGLSYVGDIERIYYKLLKAFVENYQNYIEEITTLFLNNITEYHRKIHSLKGIAKNLGSEELFELCQKIENDLENKELLTAVQKLFPRILEEAEGILKNSAF